MAIEAWIDDLSPVALPNEPWVVRTLTRLGTVLDGAALRAAQLAVNAMLIPASEDLGALRASFRIHSPLAHALQVPRERVLIVAGRGDRVVPPEHPNALWRHWGEPNIHWFSGSHLAPFARRRIVRAIVHHLEDLEIL
jgi:hypothetical protein